MSASPAPSPARGESATVQTSLRTLLLRHDAGAGFRRLLYSRLAAQWGDGMFQAALGGAVLFNPQRAADPLVIAAGLAVLLVPYSVVGPFAGALWDRWDRRRVLVTANLLRGVLIVAVAAAVGAGIGTTPLLAGVLVVTAVSRFVTAGLSAALPHVVRPRLLVEANALSVTAGAAMVVIGGGCAVLARTLLSGAGDTASGWVMAAAVPGSLVAAAVAARFPRHRLGPDDREQAETMTSVARGLVDALRAVGGVRSVCSGLLALGAHRLGFGAALLIVLLLYRYTLTADDGLLRGGFQGVGQVLVAAGAGILLAALITGPLVRRFGRRATVRTALVLAAAVALAFGLPLLKWTTLVLAFGLAVTGQVIKLSLDATVQRDIRDEVRGRVFALYDAVFNVGYVVAIGLAALIVPRDGQAIGLLLVTVGVYLAGAGAHAVLDRDGGRARAGGQT